MAVHIGTYQYSHLVYARLEGSLSSRDILFMCRKIQEISYNQEEYYILIDMRSRCSLVIDVSELVNLIRVECRRQHMPGCVLIVNHSNPLVSFTGAMVSKVLGYPIKTFHEMSHAIMFLRAIDEKNRMISNFDDAHVRYLMSETAALA